VTIDFTLRFGSIDGPAALVDTPTHNSIWIFYELGLIG